MPTDSPLRHDVAFNSSGEECRAWLFMPKAKRPPLVILGHGLGATREYGLERFARRFADAGIAALVFTYRHFGDSGGQPRQLLDIDRQLADWAAALAYARTLDEIDSSRIALWGTSFGGGHVLIAAARDGNVAAVVSQCPFTDGMAAPAGGAPAEPRQRGRARGARPARAPARQAPGDGATRRAPGVGRADDLSDSEPGYRALIPQGAGSTTASPPASSSTPGSTVRGAAGTSRLRFCSASAIPTRWRLPRPLCVTRPRRRVRRSSATPSAISTSTSASRLSAPSRTRPSSWSAIWGWHR